jgi:hypothetical protein
MASFYFFIFSKGIPLGHPILHPIICGGKGKVMTLKYKENRAF